MRLARKGSKEGRKESRKGVNKKEERERRVSIYCGSYGVYLEVKRINC